MPLSQNHKTESQSIEDLIAQLDAPTSLEREQATNDASNNNNNGENRKVIRGKRTNSLSSSGGGSGSNNKANNNGPTEYYDPVLQKNIMISKKYSKALRSTKGKGMPKKGGSGGKHTWGAPGCELNYAAVDQNDPNYDSEDAGNIVMVCMDNNTASRSDSDTGNQIGTGLQQLEVEDLDRELKPIILEYFLNGDSVEVIDHLKCYNFKRIKSQILSYIIQIALEHNNTCKELTSRLFRDFHFELFTTTDFENSFNNLFNNINDLELDNPDCTKIIGIFIARCIADKCLSDDYIFKFSNSLDGFEPPLNSKVYHMIEEAKLLTTLNAHLFHLSHIWGNQGGFTAVKDLTDKIHVLIQEYYDSGDRDEAIRCLKELNVPHFNHEFVFEALDFTLQKGDQYAIELITNLFKTLCDSVIVTHDQMKIGFVRIYDILPDTCLDVPNAYNIIEKVIDICHSKGIINNDIVELAPNRARKRFVSEGDGGKIKENGH